MHIHKKKNMYFVHNYSFITLAIAIDLQALLFSTEA